MDVGELAKAIQAGTRRALAKGITLVESQKRTHLEAAQKLLAQIEAEYFYRVCWPYVFQQLT